MVFDGQDDGIRGGNKGTFVDGLHHRLKKKKTELESVTFTKQSIPIKMHILYLPPKSRMVGTLVFTS